MKPGGEIEHIIWDWNGTLVDDLKISVDTLNEALGRNDIPPVTIPFYREHFYFPVRDFYKQLGLTFNDKDFDKYSIAFMEAYLARSKTISLHLGVKETLIFFRGKGVKQYILSAMEQHLLEEMLRDFGIREYFNEVQGLEDLHAHSKIEAGKKLLSRSDAAGTNTLMIGDTLHDFEVASGLNIPCYLLSCGHYTRERLTSAGVPVFENHERLKYFIEHENNG